MVERIKIYITKIESHANMSMFVSILIQLLVIFLFFVFRGTNLFLTVFGILLPFMIFYSFNSAIKDDKKLNSVFKFVKFGLLLAVVIFVNYLISTLLPPTFSLPNGESRSSPITIICGIVDFCVFMGLFAAFINDPSIEIWDKMKIADVWGLLGITLFERESSLGDVVLCKDIDTNKPVILPVKDRFLHMLILGPTGSGKTSQSVIPMLNQDVQNLNAGITVMEPKGDLANKIYAMAQYYGRPAIYFNPVLEGCPTFNPLYGKEEDVIENVTTTFKMLDPDSPQYFKDMGEQLLRNSLKVIKRLYSQKATMLDLSTIVTNSMGQGRKIIMEFSKLPAATDALAKENADIANYFLSDYYAERSKTYENTSGTRSQIAKIVSNKFLRKVLNPTDGKSDIDFDKHLEDGTIICISTAQGKLRDLGKFLGYFLILNFQSSVFKRPGTENTRRHHFLYIDEFQEYANPGFSQMLTQGRSYRVASHLATQNRALIGMGSGREGKDFIELVSTNARNVVIYPGGNTDDAEFYSAQFGSYMKKEYQKGITRQRFNPFYGQKVSPPSESIRFTEKETPRFTASEIIYREFGEITYAIIQDNTLQTPKAGRISYIDKDLNKRLDVMVEENEMMLAVGEDPNKLRDFSREGILWETVDFDNIKKRYADFEASERYDSIDKVQPPEETVIINEGSTQTNNPQGGKRSDFIPSGPPAVDIPVPNSSRPVIDEEIVIPAKPTKASESQKAIVFDDDDDEM